ncbi:sorting nexin-22 isoform X4 [Elephas maximus indicus]|uniref:sorting nexin-22 isoform X4 n=1 Tax=Elephas maximus indicus TaxID=99487 RepID=UPI002117254D|nr:sorting nexin-22 isoform X4 [Elephas maximus indicus]
MLEVHIPSVGPEAEESGQSPEKGHMENGRAAGHWSCWSPVWTSRARPAARPPGVPSGSAVPRAQTHRAEALQRVPRAPQADQETVQSARLPIETSAQLEDQGPGTAPTGLGGLHPGRPVPEPGCAQGATGVLETSAPPHRPQGQQLGLPAVPPTCRQLLHGSLHLHPFPRASAQCGGERCAPGPLQLQYQPHQSPARGCLSPCSSTTGALTSPEAFGPPIRTVACLTLLNST